MPLSAFAVLLLAGAQTALATCKCTPIDACWPNPSSWDSLNRTVGGRLIHNKPRAESCYPGPNYDAQACQDVASNWSNQSIVALDPIGYAYPLISSCAPINTTLPTYPLCELGAAPVYSINATDAADVSAGIEFAKDNNVRLVITNTGHDIVGRSQGYGSLSIWIKYIQTGLGFHENYSSSDGCAANWTGSAITVGGGYVWQDVYNLAAEHGHIVVGGGDMTVGAIGGYLQGGGHSPSSRYFGLATDQVLEMTVVLASGQVVTANACQHADLFRALRGGGGGTFGVVIAATIKAYPTKPMLMHNMAVIPLNTSVAHTINATAHIMSKYGLLSDTGFSGYAFVGDGSMASAAYPTSMYGHGFGLMIPDTKDQDDLVSNAKSVIEKELVHDLLPHNGTEFIVTSSFETIPTYAEYFTKVGGQTWAGVTNVILSSRMFGRESLEDNAPKLSQMLHTVFSDTDDGPLAMDNVMFLMNLVGGGAVLEPKPHVSLNPAWRKTYVLNEIISFWPFDLDTLGIKAFKNNIVHRKTDAMRALTPGMGSYINEHVGEDPDWKRDFYGPSSNYEWLLAVKEKYDPNEVFWCWGCVGSEGWTQETNGQEYGPLCRLIG